MTAHAFPTGTILGYPRIGRRRELKRAVEAFWAGAIDADELEATAPPTCARATARAPRRRWASDRDGRVDPRVVLVLRPGARRRGRRRRRARAVRDRLRSDDGVASTSAAYFTIARGEGDDAPLEMTKWFDTNYHYLVPEIGPDTAFASRTRPRSVAEFAEAKAAGLPDPARASSGR